MSIGKYIEICFKKNITKEKAVIITENSCKKLLVNPNTETYSYTIEK